MSDQKSPGSMQWIVIDEGGGWHEARGCRVRLVSLSELVKAYRTGQAPGTDEDDVELSGILLRPRQR